MATDGLRPHQIAATVRFVRGYRFLDRCGEALLQLEDKMGEGWIPNEASPRNGVMKNDALRMVVSFNSELMTIQQDATPSFEHFQDAACRAFDIIKRTLELERVIAPSCKVVYQKGFDDDQLEEARRWIAAIGICAVQSDVIALLGGKQDSLDFALLTSDSLIWDGQAVDQRRRLASLIVRQERQAPFDERLLRRVKMLPQNQRDAMVALTKLRRQLPDVLPLAVQIELEHVFETEFNTRILDYPGFIQEALDWARKVAAGIPQFRRGD